VAQSGGAVAEHSWGGAAVLLKPKGTCCLNSGKDIDSHLETMAFKGASRELFYSLLAVPPALFLAPRVAPPLLFLCGAVMKLCLRVGIVIGDWRHDGKCDIKAIFWLSLMALLAVAPPGGN